MIRIHLYVAQLKITQKMESGLASTPKMKIVPILKHYLNQLCQNLRIYFTLSNITTLMGAIQQHYMPIVLHQVK